MTRQAGTTYRTGDIARSGGVHPNTVRFYEEIGFINKPERLSNGYRVYTALHLEQVRFVRLVLRAEVLQSGLRKQAIRVIRLCAVCRFDEAVRQAKAYVVMIEREIDFAQHAISSVEAILQNREVPDAPPRTRSEAAASLGVTVDTLRNWELNGLVQIRRMQNGYRVYNGSDMERLAIIRTLRTANYSLTAILNLLTRLSGSGEVSVTEALNTPDPGESIRSVCDHLLEALDNAKADALRLPALLNRMKKIATLQ